MRSPKRRAPAALVVWLALGVHALGVGAPVRARADDTHAPDGARVARVLARAREEVTRGVVYDGRYRTLTYRDGVDAGRFVYPGGDLEPGRGVCTDVVVRALRAAGIDLQSAVHADIMAHPEPYARFVTHADANIDHRRVGPLMTYLERHATRLSLASEASFAAGDIVVWTFASTAAGAPAHVGIVGDRPGPRGLPLVIHNLGPHPTEDDALDAWVRVGHYRLAP